jgi:hypothetical protein
MRALLLGFDTEDFGRKAKSEKERRGCIDNEYLAAEKIAGLLKKNDVSATFFMVGKLIEAEPRFKDLFRRFPSDIEQHTYSHSKIFDDGFPPERPTITLGELEIELKRTNDLIEEAYGTPCVGVRLPYCYKSGIKDKPEYIALFKRLGFHWVSTELAGERNGIVSYRDPLQPYEIEGMLEFPINGLSDTAFLEKGIDLMKIVGCFRSEFAYASENDFTYIPGFHPWCTNRIDPGLNILQSLIAYAKENSIPVFNHNQFYEVR